ncbi:2OG-Fe(II) oxygenase family oxidoreductase [Sclerotinia borealis F-4128]|uniref:2OG-Fe(II) oxygenase family oxidoreductase n=1 Tax=Sclerotinia borealis (strain F-4128) TaxID=1432307 RepID=W9C1C9_SCLBF|nr:2OG-Fe(II) oxygenase family oxidoreductase [Sclerotinia borealis F-4128]
MSQTRVETITQPRSVKIPLFTQASETTHELDWADLATLDLSSFDHPGGKQNFAAQLHNAVEQIGFFYATNFGLSQQKVDHQFAIGQEFFSLSTDEKLKYRADLENGRYDGYKPLGHREIASGQFDNTEIYNIPKFTAQYDRPHPTLIKENWSEIEKFGRHIDKEIVSKLLVLFAIILELPEDFFLKTHRYDEKGDTHLRYMKYHTRTKEENEKLGNVWVKGHTDFGSLTLLKYVKPYPASITVNIADSLSFLTNGYLKSSIHRVIAPPPDQAHLDRYGVLYFVRPENNLILEPVPSPLLDRLGLLKDDPEAGPELTAGEWVRARVQKNVNKLGSSQHVGDEQEIIKGIKAPYYD